VILTTNNLIFNYNDQMGFSYPDISLNKAESLLILGASGSGKTTLLHLLAGFLEPNQGEISFVNQSFGQLKGRKIAQIRGRHMGLVFQNPLFMKSLTAIENVKLACKAAQSMVDEAYLEFLFTELNIAGKMNSKVAKLSVGEQQRVNIVRALANKPDLLLADEPTSALDDHNCEQVIKMLKHAAEINESALDVVTHDQRLKAEFQNSVVL
jgi:putative ABC transport system ATP-binding protein